MNIYIVEDDIDCLDLIYKNVDDAVISVRGQWHEKYDEVQCIKLDTLDYSITDSSSQINNNKLLSIFEDAQPHVLILDWELKWGKENISFNGDALLSLIDRERQNWNPYVIFTSSKNPTKLLSILGGKDLKRIFPTSIMLLEKSFLLERSRKTRSYTVVKEALKQSMEYASIHSIELNVYPMPNHDDYRPILSINENGDDRWELVEKAFAVSLNKSFIGKVETYSKDEIVAILTGFRETYGVVLWKNSELIIQLCHFSNKPKLKFFQKKYPFLVPIPGIFYNKTYCTMNNKKLTLKRDRFGEEKVDEFLSFIGDHVRITRDYLELTQEKVSSRDGDSNRKGLDEQNINKLYKPLLRLLNS